MHKSWVYCSSRVKLSEWNEYCVLLNDEQCAVMFKKVFTGKAEDSSSAVVTSTYSDLHQGCNSLWKKSFGLAGIRNWISWFRLGSRWLGGVTGSPIRQTAIPIWNSEESTFKSRLSQTSFSWRSSPLLVYIFPRAHDCVISHFLHAVFCTEIWLLRRVIIVMKLYSLRCMFRGFRFFH